jgi:hypothetical protein
MATGAPSPRRAGYKDIPIGTFLFALLIVSIPAFALESSNERSWAWRYTTIIILGMLITNYSGISAFTNYISSRFGI